MSESKVGALVVLSVSIGILMGIGVGWLFWAASLPVDAEWTRYVCVAGLAMIGLSCPGAVVRLLSRDAADRMERAIG